MLKNRKIEMRLVKSKKEDPAEDRPLITQDDVVTAATFTDVVGKKALKLVATYIALDTVRKIAVSRLGK